MVTGGAGFIGSHIVDLLVERGCRVLVVDNLSAGREDNLNPGAEFSDLDVCSRRIIPLVNKFKPEAVIHQAAQVSVPRSVESPFNDARVNILGTVNLLEACRLAGVRKMIYASSAAVYGEPEYLPVDEKHRLRPLSGYGLSKYTGERYLELYRQMYGLRYTVLRYANVYGPRQDARGEGGVVAKFIDRLQKGKPPLVFGDGRQTRDFVYVRDVAGANLAALSQGDDQVLNVGTGEPTGINKLAELLKDIAGCRGKVEYAPRRRGEIVHSCLANQRIKRHLSWQPRWNLEQGLKETYEAASKR
uniref:NAD-dependent epimerase/dehydratase family protein n=1 Tax=Desulforadius tongensis TaxID=1216062 RepID=UPI001A9C86DE|nr:NAD-dependent epimerase/dehydratase family protein [Desulforadius tongensis]